MKKYLKTECVLCSTDMRFVADKSLRDFAENKTTEKTEALKRVNAGMKHALCCIKNSK